MMLLFRAAAVAGFVNVRGIHSSSSSYAKETANWRLEAVNPGAGRSL
jgi:hypothetical protein